MRLVQLIPWEDKIIALDDGGSLYRITFDLFGHPSITLIWSASEGPLQ